MYGNRSPQSRAYFVNDPANTFATEGYPTEQNNVGTGVRLHLPVSDRFELTIGYSALYGLGSTATKSQQGTLIAVYRY
jgi:hypothetical protein